MNFISDRPLEPLEHRVLRYINENGLVRRKSRLVAAVSGGPDSVCLLLILWRLRGELDIDLHIAHLNHRLRGQESDEDAGYVVELADSLGIPVTVDEQDVAKYRVKHGGTLEEAAREVRYAFLAATVKSCGADAAATGHTRDDNIETVLLHLIRGTGTRGLRGLRPKTQWKSSGKKVEIIRPVLELDRRETLAYCRAAGCEPRMDSSNLSDIPLRNRIRRQLIPLLEGYNERVGDALLRTARIAGDELDFLDAAVDELWGTVAEEKEDTVVLDKRKLSGLPPALKRHLLRRSVERLTGSLKDIETRHIEEMVNGMDLQAGKRISLPGELVFVVEYDRYLLTREPSSLSPFPEFTGEHILNVPGLTELPGWKISVDITDAEKMENDANRFTAYLDMDKTGEELTVRPRKTADRFHPLGMEHSKKLGEYMIDARIPRAWRSRIPVVCNRHQIVWVVGCRIDNRVRVTDDTRRVLRLEFTSSAGAG